MEKKRCSPQRGNLPTKIGKKIAGIVLAAGLFTGCGNSTEGTPAPDETPRADSTSQTTEPAPAETGKDLKGIYGPVSHERLEEMNKIDKEFIDMDYRDFMELGPLERRGYLDNIISMLATNVTVSGGKINGTDYISNFFKKHDIVYRNLFLASPEDKSKLNAEQVSMLIEFERAAALFAVHLYTGGSSGNDSGPTQMKFNSIFGVVPHDYILRRDMDRDTQEALEQVHEDIRAHQKVWSTRVRISTAGPPASLESNTFESSELTTWTDARNGKTYRAVTINSKVPHQDFDTDMPEVQTYAFFEDSTGKSGAWVLVGADYTKRTRNDQEYRK